MEVALKTQGDVRPDAPEDGPRPDSGFVAVVSHDDCPHLLDQIGEAQDFLETHADELDRLKAMGADLRITWPWISALDQRKPSTAGQRN